MHYNKSEIDIIRQRKELKQVRHDAHRAFDSLWKNRIKYLSRKQAYELLAKQLNLTEQECHMATMDLETAKKVPKAVKTIMKTMNRARKKRNCKTTFIKKSETIINNSIYEDNEIDDYLE